MGLFPKETIVLDDVKGKITDFLPEFEKWLNTDEARESLRERDDKLHEFRTLLSPDAIEQLTELDFRRIIVSLWAYLGWTNRDYVTDRILKNTDFKIVRSELKNLLYGSEPFSSRYDRFFEKVKGIGPAGITEILAFTDPKQYSIWNDKTRKGLDILGLGQKLPTEKYKISGAEYSEVNEALKSLSRMIKNGEAEPDLIYVDLFLFYLVTQGSKEAEVAAEGEDYDFDHDEIVDKLAELGNGLGFEADTEQPIAKGAKVDVLWQAKVANLGVISYVFEVQRAGSVDSLILNLQKAKNNPTVQKLVVVANIKELKRIRNEVESLSEDFRKSLAYLEARDVNRAVNLLTELNSIISRLELVKTF